MANARKKLTLQEAVDFFEQFCDEEENESFDGNIDMIYLQPPNEDGTESGEDDAGENEGGIIDNVCRVQLMAGCEMVLQSGNHVDKITLEEPSGPNENTIEYVLADVITDAACDLAVDQPYQNICEAMETSQSHSSHDEATKKKLAAFKARKATQSAKKQRQIEEMESKPIVNSLRKIQPSPSNLAIPESNKESKFTWVKHTQSVPLPIFPEPNFDDCRNKKPHELFELFFDDALLQHISDCSAKYAVKNLKSSVDEITVAELRTFIGILFVTGYNSISSYKAYWNNDDDLRNEMIFKSMRRNRFEEILRTLHFEPNLIAPVDNQDKLWKLRPIMDLLKTNMLRNFHPTQHLSYDESVIAYYGRHGCKQFLKGKPIRFGYKSWSLCTPNGYMVNFEIYQGENPRCTNQYDERFGKCAAPLINMIDDFPDELKDLPFSFYFDNLFTSFPLLAHLKTRGYNATGTIRENRIPASCPIKHKTMKTAMRGSYETIKMNETGIRLTKWVDNSIVCAASTCYGALPTSSASRYSKEAGKKIYVTRPCIITEFSKYKCGVDRLDQNVNNYRIGYRGKKWWSSIFTWLLDVSVNNAWQLQTGSKRFTQLEFRREIAIYYCKHYGQLPIQAGPKRPRHENDISQNIRYDQTDHFVAPCEKRRRCAGDLCKSVGRTFCVKCNVGLCVSCFAKYHTR